MAVALSKQQSRIKSANGRLQKLRVGLKCSFSSSTPCEEQPRADTLRIRLPADLLEPGYDETMVIRIARYSCGNMSDNIEPYLGGLNKWLPVIDGLALKTRVRADQTFRDEGFCSLLVACALLSRISRPQIIESEVEGNNELYMTLIMSHAAMSSRGFMSLDMLQSKILLALYEHLQANYTAAVGTLRSAVGIAKVMGILRWHCLADQRMISLADETQKTLCCLYILER